MFKNLRIENNCENELLGKKYWDFDEVFKKSDWERKEVR